MFPQGTPNDLKAYSFMTRFQSYNETFDNLIPSVNCLKDKSHIFTLNIQLSSFILNLL